MIDPEKVDTECCKPKYFLFTLLNTKGTIFKTLMLQACRKKSELASHGSH